MKIRVLSKLVLDKISLKTWDGDSCWWVMFISCQNINILYYIGQPKPDSNKNISKNKT